jgi:O-methyltransferase
MLRRIRDRMRGRGPASAQQPLELSAEDAAIVERARPLTMTSTERLVALVDAVRHCERRGLPGAFVECGVWRGGSILAMILTLQALGRAERDIYLFDTFEGMTEPTERDVSESENALAEWRRSDGRAWQDVFGPKVLSEEGVRAALVETGYPPERLHFVRGPVERTLPDAAPGRIALLRLDTDWYESTRHELVHLYPRLVASGVLIVDDYGHWRGCREAVDEYLASLPDPPLLHRIDYTGRIAVKA